MKCTSYNKLSVPEIPVSERRFFSWFFICGFLHFFVNWDKLEINLKSTWSLFVLVRKMLVLVDESGDIGFKFSKGSSRLFAVTIILFKDHEEAQQCDLRIAHLYNELRLPQKFEFHFHQNSPEIQNSAGNNLLQLADMVCGAIYRSFMQKPDAQDYRKIIAHRQISVQTIPK